METNPDQQHSPTEPQTCNQPILVTGAHRTGTTWVGKMLAASGQVAYISEPLNVWHRPGVMRTPTKFWYTYICSRNEADYLIALRDTIQLHYHTWEEIKSLRSLKDLLRMGRDWNIFRSGRFHKKRTLLKDPFAIFSAPWFSQAFGCQVVITVRHPAAFASSLKRLDWPFDFKDLLSQSLLMQDWLEPFRDEMENSDRQIHENRKLHNPGVSTDTISRSSLLWRMIYLIVKEYQERFPFFKVVRHEDLSSDPQQGFQSLYNDLSLQYTPSVQQIITNSSSSDNPKELSKHKKYSVRLDSYSNLDNWKRRLSREEIYQIRSLTEDIAKFYYPDLSWE
jgi:hypothetical protein